MVVVKLGFPGGRIAALAGHPCFSPPCRRSGPMLRKAATPGVNVADSDLDARIWLTDAAFAPILTTFSLKASALWDPTRTLPQN